MTACLQRGKTPPPRMTQNYVMVSSKTLGNVEYTFMSIGHIILPFVKKKKKKKKKGGQIVLMSPCCLKRK